MKIIRKIYKWFAHLKLRIIALIALCNTWRNMRFFFSLIVLSLIVLAIAIILFWRILPKKSLPDIRGSAIQWVIQKPEPTKIEKIVRPLTSAEIAEENYQKAVEKLNEGKSDIAQMSMAMRLLKSALLKSPTYRPARELLATLLIKRGNLVEANRVVHVGLSQDPSYLPYLKLRLHILIAQGNVDQAFTLIHTAQPFAVESDVGYVSLIAGIYLQRGQNAQAAEIYSRLLRSNPNNPKWLMGLGIALESLGQASNALSVYKAALAVAPPQLRSTIEKRVEALQ